MQDLPNDFAGDIKIQNVGDEKPDFQADAVVRNLDGDLLGNQTTNHPDKDKAEKEGIKAVIQKVKDELAEFIINHPGIKGKDMLGPNIEGLIMNINGKWIKTTTPEFKASKAK